MWSDRVRFAVRVMLLAVLAGVLAGGGSALFLVLLDRVTRTRIGHPWLVFAMPLGGFVAGLVIERVGTSVRGGTSLVLDAVEGGAALPRRIAPLALAGTLVTHLFGGSAGREGTAVQMAAGLAETLARALKVEGPTRTELLRAAIAGGFGSVFGTPLAGTVFALEVTASARFDTRALLPAFLAAWVGDLVTRGLGIRHTTFPTVEAAPLSPAMAVKWLAVALVVGAVVVAFIALTDALKRAGDRWAPRLPARMVLGALALLLLTTLSGTSAYLGLGVPTIERAFVDPTLAPTAFAWKLLFTAVTLGAGYFGGEVTPLFFVGATLGNVLARLLGMPLPLTVGVAMAATFGAAARAPLALTVMAVELFGAGVFPHAAWVVLVASWLVDGRSIYGRRGARAVAEPRGDAIR